MGNAMGSKKAKVMKIDGETFKLKTPARANDVVKDYPGHVLLDSHAVKNFGPRAKPLEPDHELRPKKVYFLVELPKARPEPLTRRVRSSGIRGMNAKDRLDFLMLSKRSVSDLAVVKHGPGPDSSGPTRVRMRVPKAQLERLMEESHDGGEVAEKILSLYMGNNAAAVDGGATMVEAQKELHNRKPRRLAALSASLSAIMHEGNSYQATTSTLSKKVTFSPVEQGEIHEESAAPQKSLVYSTPSR